MSTNAPICIEPTLGSRVPAYLLTYITEEQLCRAADTYDVNRWIFCAILDRESRGGTVLTPPGPSGTGDFGHRNPNGKYGAALPPDGKGWGRGLFQKDFGAVGSTARAWCLTKLTDGRYQWEDPMTAAMEAARELAAAKARFGDDVIMIACYNAGGTDSRGEPDYHQVLAVLAKLPADCSTAQKIAALDAIPTTDAYVAGVLKIRDGYLNSSP